MYRRIIWTMQYNNDLYRITLFLIIDSVFLYYILYYLYYEINKIINNQKAKISDN